MAAAPASLLAAVVVLLVGAVTLCAGGRRAPVLVWEGMFDVLHSQSLVNRAIADELLRRYSAAFALLPYTTFEHSLPRVARDEAMERVRAAAERGVATSDVAVYVRHLYFENITTTLPCVPGKFVIFFPWEYCYAPRDWVRVINDAVDEVWVYSRYNRECFVRSGIAAERVHVVPLGVDPGVFYSLPPRTPCGDGASRGLCAVLATVPADAFRFLFVGGLLLRKGVDVLFRAFFTAFAPTDKVCLLVKEMGGGSYYAPSSMQHEVETWMAEHPGHCVRLITEELSDVSMRHLYAAASLGVFPFRSEGFGLPIAECLACGVPVVVPNVGPAVDFVPVDAALWLNASERVVHLPVETVLPAVELGVEMAQLVHHMRYAAVRPALMRHMGQIGSAHVRHAFTWARTADVVASLVVDLLNEADLPPLRNTAEYCRVRDLAATEQ